MKKKQLLERIEALEKRIGELERQVEILSQYREIVGPWKDVYPPYEPFIWSTGVDAGPGAPQFTITTYGSRLEA